MGDIKFYSPVDFDDTSSGVTIEGDLIANANVGIGTSSPDFKLDVAGDMGIDGYIYHNGDDSRIGFEGNDAIRMYTANGVRLQINYNGNVGIGTTNPGAKLHVAGFTRLENSGDKQLQFVGTGKNTFSIEHDTSRIYFYNETTASYPLAILNGGNVGIGTTSPTRKLSVVNGDIDIKGGSNSRLFLNIDTNYLYGDQNGVVMLLANDNVRFRTQNIERMRIISSGNVGIGTSSPAVKLDVVGDMQLQNTAPRLVLKETSSNKDFSLRVQTDGRLSILNDNLTSEVLTVSQDGNVGIGTTSPSAKLHVYGDMIVGGDSTDAILRFWETNNGWNIRHVASSNRLAMSNVLNGTDHFNITETGNVGIGTTNPAYKLDLKGESTAIRVWDNSDSVNSLFAVDNSGAFQGTFSNHPIRIFTNSSEKMRITSGGNVGIGTTSPYAKLDVAGNTDTNVFLGRAKIGSYVTDYMYLSHYDYGTSSNYALKQAPTGSTNVNAPTGQSVGLGINNSTKLLVNSSGDVGIGTNSPSEKLHVFGGAAAIEIDSTTNEASLKYDNSTTTATIKLANNDLVTVLGGSERMRITSAGNVGIGTTSPAEKLTVSGNANVTGKFAVGAASVHGTYDFYNQLTSYFNGAMTVDSTFTQTGGGNSTFSGNVGIGTTNPNSKLHVAGAVKAGDSSTGISLGIQSTDEYRINGIDTGGAGWNSLHLRADGTDGLFIEKDTNNVGIGTSSPNAKLHIGPDSLVSSYTPDRSTLAISDTTNGGQLIIRGQSPRIWFDATAGGNAELFLDGSKLNILSGTPISNGSSRLYIKADGNVGIGTTSPSSELDVAGTATATTFSGDLNGTINTATTAVTKANATNDTTVATTAFVQNLIGTIPAGLVFQGTWDASTNTPTLASGSGTTGHFYIVSTDGSTNLDGITDWKVGDWAVFVEQGATDAWEKVDNSSVLDGAGTGQKVALWSGSGTSNTLTDAPITVSGNNSTFAGSIHLDNDSSQLQFGDDNDMQIYHNGANGEINNTVGNFTIDSAGEITLDADSAVIRLKDGGTEFGKISKNSNNLRIYSSVQDGDILLQGNDGGSTVTALTLDMSAGGNATFAGNVQATSYKIGGVTVLQGTSTVTVGSGGGTAKVQLSTTSGVGLILDGGNVGIGTTSPGAKLDIDNGAVTDVRIRGNQTSDARIGAYNFYNTAASDVVAAISADRDGANDAAALAFDTQIAGGGMIERMRITSTGDVGIGTTSPSYKLTVLDGVNAGGVVTYSKNYSSLDTTGNAVAGLTTGYNGASAGFTFTCFGHIGGYQKIVYSCYNGSGTWVTKKVIDEGTNDFDVEASANATTITFTFKSTSGTKSYTPRVTVEATGTAINSTYA